MNNSPALRRDRCRLLQKLLTEASDHEVLEDGLVKEGVLAACAAEGADFAKQAKLILVEEPTCWRANDFFPSGVPAASHA